MDYGKITADPVWGPEIGRLYEESSPFITALARYAYARFAVQVDRQFHRMTTVDGIRVEFQPDDPYDGHEDMLRDVRDNRRLKIYETADDQAHPLLSAEQNNRFRAVHDYYGHHGAGDGASVSFSRHGEEAAWVRHSQMFTGLARRAMTTETRGQNSVFIWLNHGREFPVQKGILLPDWVSDIPERWTR